MSIKRTQFFIRSSLITPKKKNAKPQMENSRVIFHEPSRGSTPPQRQESADAKRNRIQTEADDEWKELLKINCCNGPSVQDPVTQKVRNKLACIVTGFIATIMVILVAIPLIASAPINVPYDRMALRQSKYGGVDYEHVYTAGRYWFGLSYTVQSFPVVNNLVSFSREDGSQLNVFTDNGLAFNIELTFMYRLRPSGLGALFKRFGTGYHQQIVSKAKPVVKNAATQFKLNDYVVSRTRIRDVFARELKREIEAEFDQSVEVMDECVALGHVFYPDSLISRNEQAATLLQQTEVETNQQAVRVIQADTNQKVQEIKISTQLLLDQAEVEANRIIASSQVAAKNAAVSARGESLALFFEALDLKTAAEQEEVTRLLAVRDNEHDARIIVGVEKQIYITSRFVEIAEEDGEELGFDWLLGPFNLGSSPRVFAGGGTNGNTAAPGTVGDYTFIDPVSGNPIGNSPVTSGLRSGGQAIDSNSIDALIAAAAGNGGGAGSLLSPAIFGIAGVFTDPQFQVVIRALSQKKGVDLLSAPSVMARSGNRAKIEVIREFIYPTEYDPPEIPTNFGSTGSLLGGGASSGAFPVTPATPTAFETRNTGVTLEVDPVLGADEFTIDLNLAPEVVEFDGFINYGSPISTTATDLLGNPTTVVITPNIINMPIFNTRKVTTQVTIGDNQTVALGGLIREDIQDVEDKIPFLGDLPVVGRLFRSSVELHLKRNLTIFVQAQLQDPSGQPIHGRIQDEPLPEPVPRAPITPQTFAPGPIYDK